MSTLSINIILWQWVLHVSLAGLSLTIVFGSTGPCALRRVIAMPPCLRPLSLGAPSFLPTHMRALSPFVQGAPSVRVLHRRAKPFCLSLVIVISHPAAVPPPCTRGTMQVRMRWLHMFQLPAELFLPRNLHICHRQSFSGCSL